MTPAKPKRVLGLDYGDKRVGAAVSDGLGLTATALCTISRVNPSDLASTVKRITELLAEYGADTIVLGFPRNMDGTAGSRCDITLDFKRYLEKKIPGVRVELFDERLTTAVAERTLIEADVSREKRKGAVDKMAAAQILQGYLDLKRNEAKNIIKFTGTEVKMADNENFDEIDGEGEYEIIVMTDDEGNETEFCIIDEVTDGGATYLLMVESEFADDDESDAVIFKEVIDGDDAVYEEIEDDAEFERVAALFKKGDSDYDLEL